MVRFRAFWRQRRRTFRAKRAFFAWFSHSKRALFLAVSCAKGALVGAFSCEKGASFASVLEVSDSELSLFGKIGLFTRHRYVCLSHEQGERWAHCHAPLHPRPFAALEGRLCGREGASRRAPTTAACAGPA